MGFIFLRKMRRGQLFGNTGCVSVTLKLMECRKTCKMHETRRPAWLHVSNFSQSTGTPCGCNLDFHPWTIMLREMNACLLKMTWLILEGLSEQNGGLTLTTFISLAMDGPSFHLNQAFIVCFNSTCRHSLTDLGASDADPAGENLPPEHQTSGQGARCCQWASGWGCDGVHAVRTVHGPIWFTLHVWEDVQGAGGRRQLISLATVSRWPPGNLIIVFQIYAFLLRRREKNCRPRSVKTQN